MPVTRAIAGALALFASACGGAAGSDQLADHDAGLPTIAPAPPWDRPPKPPLCAPDDVSGFTPPAYKRATGAHQGRCTQAQIQGLWGSCFNYGGFGNDCGQWSSIQENKDCAACVMTDATEAAYGPIICHEKSFVMNYAGCMELLGDRDCAVAASDLEACGEAACDARCLGPGLYRPEYESCRVVADEAGCSAYFAAAACADREADGGPAAYCFRSHDFGALFLDYTMLFCGP